jgi:hypothetical protein
MCVANEVYTGSSIQTFGSNKFADPDDGSGHCLTRDLRVITDLAPALGDLSP